MFGNIFQMTAINQQFWLFHTLKRMTKTHRLRIFTKSVKEGATDSTKVQKLDQRSVQIVNETATLKSNITVVATDAAIFNTTTAVQPIAKKIC